MSYWKWTGRSVFIAHKVSHLRSLPIFFSVRFLEGRADSIAKPFYTFIDILFDEQRAMMKLIRMTLVQFIRVTYGSTINRQVRRFIVGLFQEECLVKYLILLRDTFWPKTPAAERPTANDEEKLERRQQAKQQLLTNIPGLKGRWSSIKTGIFHLIFRDGVLDIRDGQCSIGRWTFVWTLPRCSIEQTSVLCRLLCFETAHRSALLSRSRNWSCWLSRKSFPNYRADDVSGIFLVFIFLLDVQLWLTTFTKSDLLILIFCK